MWAAATSPRSRTSASECSAPISIQTRLFRITKIYPGEKLERCHALATNGTGLKVSGRLLIAVDGQETHSNQDVYSYFQDLAGKLVTLKINSKSTLKAPGNHRKADDRRKRRPYLD